MADCDEMTPAWRKSTRSNSGGCVEMALSDRVVLLRDSKRPEGPVLSVPPGAWAALLARVRNLADMTPLTLAILHVPAQGLSSLERC